MRLDRISRERSSRHIATAFITSALIFMFLPGTFLGVWNLVSISSMHGPNSLAPAWLQAHGHAQLFGWVGSFIIGIGFYSLTKVRSTLHFPVRAGWSAWILWTVGISLRWYAGIALWRWRLLLPISAALELVAFGFFARSVRRHQPRHQDSKPEAWMRVVMAATVVLSIALVANFATTIYVALYTNTPELPHLLDQQLVLFFVWGIPVPTIWGFNARWLPVFAGLQKPDGRSLLAAYTLSVAGIAVFFLHWAAVSAALLLMAGLLSIDALRLWDSPIQPAKLLHIHPLFLRFIQIAYLWLILSCLLFAIAVISDHNGGIWGASRHALTVGFIAGMIFAIAPCIVTAFCGMRILWSARLMFWSLFLLYAGCALRIITEPLAYEMGLATARTWLPVSAFLELAAVILFALNLGVTLIGPPAHLQEQVSTP
jgi:uncharacterized protein involved in response to NO